MDLKISVVGTGYVGLVAAVCFAQKYSVVCVDTDREKVDLINSAISPFFEPELDSLLKKAVDRDALTATTEISSALDGADFVFISVGTPSLHSGAIDLSYVETAAEQIGEAIKDMNKYVVIVQRSTVIPTTTRSIVKATIEKLSGRSAGKDFGIAFVPEFLREGSAVWDFLHPDRIIVGTQDEVARNKLFELYSDFYSEISHERIVSMSIESAELVKYASNAFLATKISFANELANIAEIIPGVDIGDVMNGVGLDHRISPHFFGAGVGFGGSCFPKDVKALINFARTNAIEPILLEAVMERNSMQVVHIVDMAEDAIGSIEDKKIAILGLSFKPNTSDMREAPSLKIISELIERGAGEIVATDPKAIPEAKRILGDRIKFAENPEQTIMGADCAIVITEWDEFKKISPDIFERYMRTPVVIDARRIYDYEKFAGKVKIFAVGRRANSFDGDG